MTAQTSNTKISDSTQQPIGKIVNVGELADAFGKALCRHAPIKGRIHTLFGAHQKSVAALAFNACVKEIASRDWNLPPLAYEGGKSVKTGDAKLLEETYLDADVLKSVQSVHVDAPPKVQKSFSDAIAAVPDHADKVASGVLQPVRRTFKS